MISEGYCLNSECIATSEQTTWQYYYVLFIFHLTTVSLANAANSRWFCAVLKEPGVVRSQKEKHTGSQKFMLLTLFL